METEADKKLGLFIKLESFLQLEYNWDSYGAKPPTPECIEMSKNFLTFLLNINPNLDLHLFPHPNGKGVQFEFSQKGYELEIEVRGDGSIMGDFEKVLS